jgi:hypothetical protein
MGTGEEIPVVVNPRSYALSAGMLLELKFYTLYCLAWSIC